MSKSIRASSKAITLKFTATPTIRHTTLDTSKNSQLGATWEETTHQTTVIFMEDTAHSYRHRQPSCMDTRFLKETAASWIRHMTRSSITTHSNRMTWTMQGCCLAWPHQTWGQTTHQTESRWTSILINNSKTWTEAASDTYSSSVVLMQGKLSKCTVSSKTSTSSWCCSNYRSSLPQARVSTLTSRYGPTTIHIRDRIASVTQSSFHTVKSANKGNPRTEEEDSRVISVHI